MTKIHSKGFTLVELLVVIGIIAILGVVAITAMDPAKTLSRARDGRRKTDIKTTQGALELYFSQNRAYPATAPSNPGLTFGDQLTDGTNVFMKVLPQDPSATWGYCYTQLTATSYVICAPVEDAGSVSVPTGVTSCIVTATNAPPPPTKAGDYCVTNPF
ncbi:MAG: prepilin-type N-terminal cleavage/methylation domain-containing protein [candidate division WWE3 bacterium]|nr:prepilin-type N-terminal cleavage/methylation domain-containing protein [candidate division WWE3 bacterium]